MQEIVSDSESDVDMHTAVISDEDVMDETKQGAQEEEEDQADYEETVKDSDWTLFEDDANTD